MRGQTDYSKYQCAFDAKPAEGYMRSKTAAYYLCGQHFKEMYDRWFTTHEDVRQIAKSAYKF